jgi:hypothetical protein
MSCGPGRMDGPMEHPPSISIHPSSDTGTYLAVAGTDYSPSHSLLVPSLPRVFLLPLLRSVLRGRDDCGRLRVLRQGACGRGGLDGRKLLRELRPWQRRVRAVLRPQQRRCSISRCGSRPGRGIRRLRCHRWDGSSHQLRRLWQRPPAHGDGRAGSTAAARQSQRTADQSIVDGGGR